jgi:hypothetical protein
MANENQNTPGAQGPNQGPNQGSNQLRSTGKELLDSLKEQLRLEGDFRDILRDSVRELQKSIKKHDTIAAKLESYNNTTINTRQVQVEITKNLIEQNINQRKLSEYALKLGGAQSEQVKVADEYLKSLEERSSLEDSYLNKRSEFFTLENKFKEGKKEEFESITKYLEKLEDQRKLEGYIASLSEQGISEEELTIEKRQLDTLKNQILLKEQSFSVDQQSYLNSKNILNEANKSVKKKEDEINAIQQGLNLEQAAYIQAKKTNELYDSNNDKLKSQEDFEKRSQKNAGVLGKLVGGLAEKFKVSEEVQAQMVLRQKELAASAIASGKKSGTFSDKFSVAKVGVKAIGRGLVDNFKTDPVFKYGAALGVVGLAYKGVSAGLDMVGNAAAKAGNYLVGLSEDSGNLVRGLTGGIADMARKIPLVGGLVGGLIDGFSALLDLVLGVDNMIVQTGRQLNLSAESARGLYRGLAAASQAAGDIYTTGKKLLQSQLELTQQTGITNQFNLEILRTNIKLKEFAGLEADARARIAESAQITGKSAEGTVKSVLGQVKGLQRAIGVSFQYQQVLKEVSNLGGYLGLQFAKYPEKLTKAFLTSKALGLELKQLDGMASSFLDFESSISKEFEAQLLTGKDINLSKARELFLNNDLAGAAAEIAKYTGDAAGYSKMNRIQQDSLAEAMGMSRDQMADMLKQQELYSKFGVKNREDLLKQVDLLRTSGREQDAINKAGGEAAYNDLVRASAQEKLALTIEKIKQSIVEFIERSGIIEKVEAFVDKLSNPDTIRGIIGTIRDTISTFIKFAGDMLADVIEIGGEIADFFTPFGKTDYSEKAKITGAKVREGSLEMSDRIKGTGNYGATSVENAAAKDKLKSEPQSKKEDNSMSMAGGKENNTKVYNIIIVDPVTGKTIEKQVDQQTYEMVRVK